MRSPRPLFVAVSRWLLLVALAAASPGQERAAAAEELLAAAERHAAERQHEQAVAAFTAAIELAPGYRGYLGRARSLAELGSYPEAVEDYGAALGLQPGDPAALRGRGLAQELAGEHGLAVSDLDHVLAASPDDVDALAARGRALSRLGEPERALQDFERVLASRPGDPYAMGWRGVTCAELGEFERAETDLAAAFASPGAEPWFRPWYGYVLVMRERFRRARDVLRAAVTEDPESDWALSLLARAEYELGELAAGLEHIDRAIRIDPDHGYHHLVRAWILEALGRDIAARLAMEEAARLDPSLEAYGGTLEEPVDPWLGLVGFWVLLLVLFVPLSVIALALRGRANAAIAQAADGEHPAAGYDGQAGELFAIYLQNVVLTVLTLGVYRFWARVRTARYQLQHTRFAGGRFDYHATGRQKFVGFLKGLLLLSPLLAVLWLLYRVLEPRFGEDAAFAVCFWSFAAAMFLLRPLILVGSQRFNLARTTWNHLPFRFTGPVGDAYRIYLRDLVLLVATFGIYTAWHQCNVRRFRLEHTRMGESRFGFRGSGGELFGIHLLGGLLVYLTAGIYLPWYVANLRRFHVDNTTYEGRRFESRLTGGTVFAIGVPAVLAAVGTLGLALPWAAHEWQRMLAGTTVYRGRIDADHIEAIRDARSSAVAEGIGEAGDALSELGDLFGG